MTKKPKHGKWSAANLYDTYKVPTRKMTTKRAGQLYAAARRSKKHLFLCNPKTAPCSREGCPRCERRVQVEFMREMEDHFAGEEMSAVTIIPDYGKLAFRNIADLDLFWFKRKVQRTLRHWAPECFGVFCIDISLEVSTAKKKHWQVHVHGIIGGLTEEASDQLGEAFRWEDEGCKDPKRVAVITNFLGWLAYMTKPNFFMRDHGTVLQDRAVQPSKLSIEVELKLARILSSYRVGTRIFTTGI